MAEREVDGFLLWAEANQLGEEAAVAYVVSQAKNGRSPAKRHHVVTTKVFRSLEDAQGAANHAVKQISSVSEKGVPSPLVYQASE